MLDEKFFWAAVTLTGPVDVVGALPAAIIIEVLTGKTGDKVTNVAAMLTGIEAGMYDFHRLVGRICRFVSGTAFALWCSCDNCGQRNAVGSSPVCLSSTHCNIITFSCSSPAIFSNLFACKLSSTLFSLNSSILLLNFSMLFLFFSAYAISSFISAGLKFIIVELNVAWIWYFCALFIIATRHSTNLCWDYTYDKIKTKYSARSFLIPNIRLCYIQ